MIKKAELELTQIKPNENNPRFILEPEFDKLYQSIIDFPEMASVKQIVVNNDYVILGGNMRYHAMKKAGWDKAQVLIVDWSEDKQREFMIKDNVHHGDWDYAKLAEKWHFEEAKDWGIDISKWEFKSGESIQLEEQPQYETESRSIPCPYCGVENGVENAGD